jgi:hypothetical protein
MKLKIKDEAILVQVWAGRVASVRLRLQDFQTVGT